MQVGRAEVDLDLLPRSPLLQWSGAERDRRGYNKHTEPGSRAPAAGRAGAFHCNLWQSLQREGLPLVSLLGPGLLSHTSVVCSTESGRCQRLQPAPKRRFM